MVWGRYPSIWVLGPLGQALQSPAASGSRSLEPGSCSTYFTKRVPKDLLFWILEPLGKIFRYLGARAIGLTF